MKILSTEQTRKADEYTIENEPISSLDLMERAAGRFTEWFTENFDNEMPVAVFCGQGNNGGDGLVAARLLQEKGYTVQTFVMQLKDKGSPDFEENLKRLQNLQKDPVQWISDKDQIPQTLENAIVVDALFGSGLDRPLEGLPAALVDFLNNVAAIRVAIDMPSGLYADQAAEGTIFKADYTFSFERPKLSFFFAGNFPYVGYWISRSIGLDQQFIAKQDCKHHLIDYSDAAEMLKERSKFDHKGHFGHALLIGGTRGKTGAIIMAAEACMRSGAGLTTAHIPENAVSALHSTLPEVMLSIDAHKYTVSEIEIPEKVNAIGIGPGLSTGDLCKALIKNILDKLNFPAVWDADALNILAKNKELLQKLSQNSILTPHPKEFERLFGKTKNDWQQMNLLTEKAQELNLIIVLKGGHTAVALPDGNIWWNNTGNPGMAKGGSGDVLTGIITGFLAQKYSPQEAAVLGVYLHGLAGDLALEQYHPNFLAPRNIIEYINTALIKLETGLIDK